MKTISSLQKPVNLMPSLSLPFSSQSAGPLLAKLNSLRQKPQAQIQPGGEPLLQVLTEDSSSEDKVDAIGELTGLVEDYNFYDPRLIPVLMETYGKHEGKLKGITLTSLLRIIRKVPLHDIELLPFLHGVLVNDRQIDALWNLRVILSRRSITQLGLITAVSGLYKSSKGLNYEAASLAVMSAYLSHNKLGTIDDLQILAKVADGKHHKTSSTILEGNKTYTVRSYLDEVMSKRAPELRELVSERGDFVLLSTAAIRAEAVFRLAQRIGGEQLDIDELITLLESTSKDAYSPSRTNSIACIHELANKSDYLDGRMLSLLRTATKDLDDVVRENAYEGLQLAVCRHSVLVDDLQPLFTKGVQAEPNPQVKVYAVGGLSGILEVRPLSDSTLLDSLITIVDDHSTLPELRALALLAIAKYIKQNPSIHPRLKEVAVRAARDKYDAVKANALLVLASATACKGFVEAEDMDLFIANADDSDPDVRSNAILGIKNYLELLEEGTASYLDLEDTVRRHLRDDVAPARTNALYAFGDLFSSNPGVGLQHGDLELLIYVGSRDRYEPARAATYALSVVVNKDISEIERVEHEDRIEILCTVFGGCLPEENDNYDKSIKAALGTLEQRFEQWKKSVAQETVTPPLAFKRFAIRDELHKGAIKQISLRANDLYRELLAAGEAIKSLEAMNLTLELKLQREREIRQKLEKTLTSLAMKYNQLYNIYNPPNKTSSKMGSKVVLWLLERCLKEHGFHIPRMINDLRAKLIVGYTVKRPIQKGFGLPEALSRREVEETIEGNFDMFESEQ
ncbi:MAG: hypothetical protein HYY52_02195 [Candidatus Melainabacteria bacterium]|nr:hypothetical protein [Candidatus Melainabacteria bacterium]